MTKYDENEISFYMFKCKSDNIYNCYVGHTTNFTRRKSDHKKCCINEKNKKFNLKIYKTIRENGGWDNWSLIEIHKQFCKDKREAERIEQDLIEKNNADMNTHKAFRTEEQKKEYLKEYREDNKEYTKQYSEEYYQRKKGHIKQYNKERYNMSKEKKLMGLEDKN